MPKSNAPASYLQRRRWSVTDARAALDDLKASGLTTTEFARRHGLEVHRLYRWQRELDESFELATGPAGPALIEIRPRQAEPVEIILGSGRILRVAETVDPAAVARLVDVLERVKDKGC